jgi:hypothetical protein
MSRHILKPLDSNHKVVLGWDPPLHVFHPGPCLTIEEDSEKDQMVVWIGADLEEVTLEEVMVLAKEYAIIPPQLETTIRGDMVLNLSNCVTDWR